VNGENMSLKWDLHDLHRLQIFDYSDAGPERGWKSIHVSDGDHPYTGKWWVPGLQLGYEHSFIHQVVEFIAGLESGKGAKPDFKDGLATDYVVDAVLASAKTRKWAKVKQVKA
jgi:myo-inositol 2-dehydrogenase/D-chiro-inositol 1-dehydrogenase